MFFAFFNPRKPDAKALS
ncbi:Protein of unknown function [Lactobacillus delbrueckii subsp. lactis]|nr:Protein of unknown function [Lactobacillus delbrueckii subsp. lactis]